MRSSDSNQDGFGGQRNPDPHHPGLAHAEKAAMPVRIDATADSPLVNPCFTIRNWEHQGTAEVKVTGAKTKEIRHQGDITDTDGAKTMVIWLELAATSPLALGISGAKPPADDVHQTR